MTFILAMLVNLFGKRSIFNLQVVTEVRTMAGGSWKAACAITRLLGSQSGKIFPVAEYDHSLGCSITGGSVYRGSNFPALAGYYFYGDFCGSFSLHKDPALGWTSIQLVDTPYSLSTFGEDEQGELYLADYAARKIYNIQYGELGLDTTGVFRPRVMAFCI